MLKICTLTGIDEQTNLNDLVALSREFPFVEWAMLYSPDRAGKEVRYMSQKKLIEATEFLKEKASTALHLCGASVPDFVENIGQQDFTKQFDRIQLNFNMRRSKFTFGQLQEAVNAFMSEKRPLITQHHSGNDHLSQAITGQYHHVLFDSSGGSGKSVTEWPERFEKKFIGYAGGLGPETIEDDLKSIAHHAHHHNFWIDMESKIRTNDLLDIEKCHTVLSACEPFVHENSSLSYFTQILGTNYEKN